MPELFMGPGKNFEIFSEKSQIFSRTGLGETLPGVTKSVFYGENLLFEGGSDTLPHSGSDTPHSGPGGGAYAEIRDYFFGGWINSIFHFIVTQFSPGVNIHIGDPHFGGMDSKLGNGLLGFSGFTGTRRAHRRRQVPLSIPSGGVQVVPLSESSKFLAYDDAIFRPKSIFRPNIGLFPPIKNVFFFFLAEAIENKKKKFTEGLPESQIFPPKMF